MTLAWGIFFWALAMLLPASKVDAAPIATPAARLEGRVIEDPERYSGIWETPDGAGGALGLLSSMNTEIEGAATTLVGVRQQETGLWITTYRRQGDKLELGSGSLSDRYEVQWDGTVLRLYLNGLVGAPGMRFDPIRQVWSGFFRLGRFAQQVTLRRPTLSRELGASPLVGTWAEGGWRHDCLHVVQHADGTLMGWADGLQMPGRLRYANGIKPLPESFENYGDPVRVARVGGGKFTVEFGAYGGICCSHTMTVGVASNSSTLTGSWEAGANQTAASSVWERVHGESCRVVFSRPAPPGERKCP